MAVGKRRRGVPVVGGLVGSAFLMVLCLSRGWSDSPVLRWSGNGHYYQLVDNWLSWTEAKADAEARGGYLVTITSDQEQQFIVRKFAIPRSGKLWWIGLYQDEAPYPGAWAPDEHWRWVTGEPVIYTHWREAGPKEPNDSPSPQEDNQENYGHLNDDDTGTWNDLQVAWYVPIHYIVEWNSDPMAPAPPTLSWVGTSGYQTDGVDPNRGEPRETRFRFKVRYADVNGNPPRLLSVLLRREGVKGPPRELGMIEGVGDYSGGVVYRRSLKLPPGAYEYRFRARDRDGWATGQPTQWRRGPVLESPPKLRWLGTSGYESDGVDPDGGVPRTTRFRFKVLYIDADGHAPKWVALVVRRNGRPAPFRELPLLKGLGTYTDGVVYRITAKLPAGAYEYAFRARDRNGWATGQPTRWTPGPLLGPAGAVALTGLSSRPTNLGVQVTFTLSSAARVQARVLNIAGRPIRTLCHASECDAGTNTLLWNAQSDSGLAVPKGMYLVEVTAKAADGGQARGLGQVVVGP